jgi:drug/metabolite transporter (DMT)-like permease
MLISGVIATVLRKITFLMEAKGLDGDTHAFAKPWFGTLEMFLGELIVLPLCLGMMYYQRSKAAALAAQTGKVAPEKPSPPRWYLGALVGTSFCDLAGTTLAGIGLLFIPASVYQILRGSIILFTAIFGYFILKRTVSPVKMVGIAIVFCGLAIVGVSAVFASPGGGGSTMVIVGFMLVIAGQACNGLQFAIQELLIENHNVDALSIVGWEGLYGTLMMSFFVLPILQHIPGDDQGSQENTLDTLAMLGNSAPLLVLNMIVYPIVIAALNGFALLITENMSALYRCLIDASRVLLVWIVDLVIFTFAPTYGEKWTNWSWMQLGGFVVFFFGMLVYRELVPPINRLVARFTGPKYQVVN